MTSGEPGAKVFRYSPLDHIGPLISASITLAAALILFWVAAARQYATAGKFGFFLLLCMIRPLYQQAFMWRTQAVRIQADAQGLAGKPLLGAVVRLPWAKLATVETTAEGILAYLQIEMRSQSGQVLRASFALADWRELMALIQERCPRCSLEVQPPEGEPIFFAPLPR